MAEKEGAPKGLKIATRSGIILFDSSWIAGVDYDENINDGEPNYDDNQEVENEVENENEENQEPGDPEETNDLIIES